MKPSLWHSIAFILFILVIHACDETERHKRMVSEIMEVDREFSRLSLEIGAPESFLRYIDDSCVLLRPNRAPVIGRNSIEEMYSKPDTSFSLSWEPLAGDISETGDLGYTYGIYTVQMDSPEGKNVKKEGTYVTIWKKDRNGEWKFVMDTGNQGLGNKNGEME